MAKAVKPVPEGYHTVTAHLTLESTARAIDWYKKAFGAEEVGRHSGPDGKIMHAAIKIGDSHVMMHDVMAEGGKAPKAYGGSPVSFFLFVENSDTLFNRAVGAGAQVQVPMQDQFWGDRAGAVSDPEGYTWWIATHKEDLTPAELDRRAEESFKKQPQPTH